MKGAAGRGGGAQVAQGMYTDLAVEIERDCKRNDQRGVDDLRACASTSRYRTDRTVQYSRVKGRPVQDR